MDQQFSRYIGIDYSGSATPRDRLSGLQVYKTDGVQDAVRQFPPSSESGRITRWNRFELYEWLCDELCREGPCVVGIDHGFSFPKSYFDRYSIACWDDLLDDFATHWPTDRDGITVGCVRKKQRGKDKRSGNPSELRLTEQWTASAKSVFQFDVQGQVATSTHAGLPWLRRLREKSGSALHFWPFDGWEIARGRSVVAEVYPSLLRKRYPRGDRTVDQQDAYSVCRWLAEMDRRDALERFFQPPLTASERKVAHREGWILGVC